MTDEVKPQQVAPAAAAVAAAAPTNGSDPPPAGGPPKRKRNGNNKRKPKGAGAGNNGDATASSGGSGDDSSNPAAAEVMATSSTTNNENNATTQNESGGGGGDQKNATPKGRKNSNNNNRRKGKKNPATGTTAKTEGGDDRKPIDDVEGKGASLKSDQEKVEPGAASNSADATKPNAMERRRIKRRNQRLRKKQERANAGSNTDDGAKPVAAAVASSSEVNPPSDKGTGKGSNQKKKGDRNTESFDPASTLVRPSLRVHVAPGGDTKEYTRPLKQDDVVLVPEMFGKENDMSIYDRLVEEIQQLQTDNVKGAEWVSWHQGAHKIAKDAQGSKTFQEVTEKLCEYFHVKKDTTFARLNWYQDSMDWKPFHHDAAAFNKDLAKKQNVTIGVSFGACRELAFFKTKSTDDIQQGSNNDDACRVYFPQPNNSCLTFGRDVNINFKHGINALPESEQDGKGRISIILWGWTDNVIEEEGSPSMVGDAAVKAPSKATQLPQTAAKEAKVLEQKKKRNERRKKKRQLQRLQWLEEQNNGAAETTDSPAEQTINETDTPDTSMVVDA